jgi:hypothetical protein
MEESGKTTRMINYGTPVMATMIHVTENGCGAADEMAATGTDSNITQ